MILLFPLTDKRSFFVMSQPIAYMHINIIIYTCAKYQDANIIVIGASLSEPHIYVKYVNSVCLSVCLSVRTFITRQFTNVVLIYGVPSTVDCSFEDDVFCTVFVSTNTL